MAEARFLEFGVEIANVFGVELHAAMNPAGQQATAERAVGEHGNAVGRAPASDRWQDFAVNLALEEVVGRLV